jgi:hypothetical protein
MDAAHVNSGSAATRFKTLPQFPLRWPSPAEMWIKAAQAGSSAAGRRKGNGNAPRLATGATPQSVGARARALLRDQLPKPETSIMAAAEAAKIPEPVLIAAACVLKVRTRKGQSWLLG